MQRRCLQMIALGCLATGILLFSGCATSSANRPLPLTGNPAQDAEIILTQAPERERLLYDYRVAARAMRKGQYEAAKRLLDDAIAAMGGIRVGDQSARRARSYFREESVKTFLGEPYERIMAYYYRGILYWMDGEPDNARACFRSGQVIDGNPEEGYRNDWVLLEYLDGLATRKLGGDGSDALERARKVSRMAVPPPYLDEANVLVFVEMGQGPTKFAAGEYGEKLKFRVGQSASKSVMVQGPNSSLRVPAYDNVSYQATTRGGRVMDHILANKAVFKSTTGTVGDAAIISGVVLAGNKRTQEAGLGLAAVGLLSKIISESTTPKADTRDWDNLPQYLGFGMLALPAGEHTLRVEFLDEFNRPIPSKTLKVHLNISEPRRDTVVFLSDRTNEPHLR